MRLWQIRKAQATDIDAIKRLFDRYRTELGFVVRPSLSKSVEESEVLVASDGICLLGCAHYHHRRDGQTTLYHIAVESSYHRKGIGKALIAALDAECRLRNATRILLRCPAGLAANQFYKHCGFHLLTEETGKHRTLNVWTLECRAHE